MNFNRLFTALAVVMSVYSMIFIGWDAGKHNYGSMGVNIILSVFWTAVLGLIVFERIRSAQQDQREETGRQLEDWIDKLTDEKVVEDLHEKMLTDTLVATIKEISPDKLPTAEQIPEIERLFGERTSHKVELKLEEGGMAVRIDKRHGSSEDDEADDLNQLFEDEPTGGLKPPLKAPKRTQIPVVDLDEEAAKRAKRREAGLKGAATRKRNEMRAKRLAKKNGKK